jgi:hypothetical protein
VNLYRLDSTKIKMVASKTEFSNYEVLSMYLSFLQQTKINEISMMN